MQVIISLLFLSLFSSYALAQTDDAIDPINDLYGLTIELDSVILITACDCCVGAYNSQSRCVLYSGRVINYFFNRDSSVYRVNDLTNVSYFVIEVGDGPTSDILHEKLIVIAENSCDREIIKVNGILKSPIVPKDIHAKFAISVGLKNCVTRSIWNKFLSFLGSKKARNKYKVLPANKSAFVKAIN